MATPGALIESLFERAEAYGKTTYELTRFKSLETTTIVVTSVVTWLSVIIMMALFALVFSLGIALWLGDLLGKPYYGLFIVAGFYLMAGIVLHFFLSKWIKKSISDLIITLAFNNTSWKK